MLTTVMRGVPQNYTKSWLVQHTYIKMKVTSQTQIEISAQTITKISLSGSNSH